MAMTDYPYPTSFLEPMPAWPVNEAVKPYANITVDGNRVKGEKVRGESINMTARDIELMNALNQSTSIYFNYTGAYPCTNLSDTEGTGDLDGYGWNILACNQLAMPLGYGADSMFIPEAFDYDSYTKMCQKTYGLTPDYDWALTYFGGYNITQDFLSATNIVFSNGELDPWRAGGLNSNVTVDKTGVALYIEGGAHHLDLRLPNVADPTTVTTARNIEMMNIQNWIAEYRNITVVPQ